MRRAELVYLIALCDNFTALTKPLMIRRHLITNKSSTETLENGLITHDESYGGRFLARKFTQKKFSFFFFYIYKIML